MMPGDLEWSARYDLAFTPWDLGIAHPELSRRLADDASLGLNTVGNAYVPGCGSGHDAKALAAAGWDVTAVDFARGVETELRRRLAPYGSQVYIDDALSFTSPVAFDLILDHTFFCALAPETRPAFGAMVDRLLGADGALISIVYPLDKSAEAGGPPWGIDEATISDALGSNFATVSDEPRGLVPGRRWPHVWTEWTRD